ncbi:hypothetical protein JOB18_018062 [Solea senegalensis]|uniref:Uncharacterized protein n=1 Tax=Solea senegalensis TaxID=28829 RepID=A0AAV6QHA4_SOLSE|nr:hypothetical protein JOB18_018062 [Solea senegalensis]
MGTSDIIRKGKGCKDIHFNFILTWSGVEPNQRATHGVGIILHLDTANNFSDTVCISERIIKITIREKDSTSNYFQVYAPCNDSYTEENRLFKQLSDNLSQVPVQWFGHVTRMPTTQPALRAYTARYSGVRARGRPRRRWIEGVAESFRAHGMNFQEATHLAAERQLHLPATPTQA